MKIVFETPPVPATLTNPHAGTTSTTFASFRVYMVEANEQLPAMPTITDLQCGVAGDDSQQRARVAEDSCVGRRVTERSFEKGADGGRGSQSTVRL